MNDLRSIPTPVPQPIDSFNVSQRGDAYLFTWKRARFGVVRQDGACSISKDAVMVKGRRYACKSIAYVYCIKEPERPEPASILVLHNSGFSKAIRQISTQAKDAISRRMTDNNWQLCFRYGEKNIILATGLREDTAKALFESILEALKNGNW